MSYTQLTQDERYHIQYLSRHCTIAEIAKQLNRHKSTISREIKRHCIQGQQYSTDKAQRQNRLTKQRTTGSHSITAPFTATFAKTKATAALCGNTSEYAANPMRVKVAYLKELKALSQKRTE